MTNYTQFPLIPQDNGYFSDFNIGGRGLNNNSFTPIPDIDVGRGNSGFDLFGQGGANIASGLQGVGSLLNAYAAYKQFGLGKDTLRQNRAAFNRNLSNQSKITNAEIQDRSLRRAAQRSDLAGNFAAIQEAADRTFNDRKISGEPI